MTDAEIAILSLLAEGPHYDHTLNDLIEKRGLRRWTAIGSSSLYYVLDKLEKQGLVRKLAEEVGRRRYRISSAGIAVLQTAMVDLLATPHGYDKYFELGLANLQLLKTSQIRSALLNRRHDLHTLIENAESASTNETENANNFNTRALFSHRMAMLNAELTWLTGFLAEWEAQATADPEPEIEVSEIPRARQVVLPHDPDSIHKQPTQLLPPERLPTPLATRARTGRLKRRDGEGERDKDKTSTTIEPATPEPPSTPPEP
jgi:DNA-binding PadR family transcriptional regulator